jgi:hypothetical protein
VLDGAVIGKVGGDDLLTRVEKQIAAKAGVA